MAEETLSPEDERQMHFRKIDAEIAKIFTENERTRAETIKIQAEAKWYPFLAVAGVLGAAIGVVKLFM
jgi:hypothetical protein